VSPYSPVSRRFRNVLYLDVEAVPELVDAPEARALLAAAPHAERLRAARAAPHVDYEGVMAAKRPVLEALHRAARRLPAGDARRADYARFLAREGEALDRFATFLALDEHFRPRGCGWWREWPAEYHDPRDAAVAAFRAAHAEAVDFHRWCQFALDRQLGEVAWRARERGLAVGLYQDLAIGASPSSADVWGEPELFLRGVSIGAPPDPLGPEGQNWGLPPMDPRRLAGRGFAPWAELVRSAMRHSGALRIDHVLGLFRQFWIPEGMDGRHGAYVRFPSDALLGVLALEATRAGALVVGEDLGTVPPEVPPAMARWGLLSSKVLVFEREADGAFRAPRAYPRMALATANTHDLAPLAGWWAGRDVALRRDVGLVAEDHAVAAAQAERVVERARLVALLVDEGLLDPAACAGDPGEPSSYDARAIRAAVHALLRRTPSWLVGISLDDVLGEAEPVNVPGVGPDRFPVWRRRLGVELEALATQPGLDHVLGVERAGA
jgi:4-alpha-glucanotransferase